MTDLELESYALGSNVGVSLLQTRQEIDVPKLVEAISAVLNNEEVKMTQEDVHKHLQAFGKKVEDAQAAAMSAAGEANIEKGQAFLEANKAKEGVTVTESGLQYEVLEQGDGEKPTADSTVRVHYAGTTIDGAEFDSSYKRGEPTEFPVGAVIPGWTEALQLMSVGSKYRLAIPSEIAYGPQGAGQAIGPNEALCFDVELLAIV